ncbi:hypothetical protein C8Q80DRAFT_954693 [Daedaleopsis nitida]|nr:hypothetical protein C8Q80DRAFT_954693 [Daedaleopsis nitida]
MMNFANLAVVAVLGGVGFAFPLESTLTVTVFPESCMLPSPSTAIGPPSFPLSSIHPPSLSPVTTFLTDPDPTAVPVVPISVTPVDIVTVTADACPSSGTASAPKTFPPTTIPTSILFTTVAPPIGPIAIPSPIAPA